MFLFRILLISASLSFLLFLLLRLLIISYPFGHQVRSRMIETLLLIQLDTLNTVRGVSASITEVALITDEISMEQQVRKSVNS